MIRAAVPGRGVVLCALAGLIVLAAAMPAAAGAVEFGTAELERAFVERGLNPRAFRIHTQVSEDPSESYSIAPGLITGGDLRGVMYGLLAAAEQIRTSGRLSKAAASPALAIRGVRMAVKDLGAEWFQSREYWMGLFATLVRSRCNRFHLALPYLSAGEEALEVVTQAASEFGIDFTLGVWGETDGQPAAEFAASLTKVLSAFPTIRTVQVRVEDEAAMYAVRVLHDAGRRMTLEAPAKASTLPSAASSAGVPIRIAREYPDGTSAGTRLPFYWEISRESYGSTAAVSGLIARLIASGAGGFEIDLPPGPEGAAAAPELAWGRLGYDGGIRAATVANSTPAEPTRKRPRQRRRR